MEAAYDIESTTDSICLRKGRRPQGSRSWRRYHPTGQDDREGSIQLQVSGGTHPMVAALELPRQLKELALANWT